MLEIRIIKELGRIKSYSAIGHADNTCGSITCVSRTFVLLIQKLSGISISYDAPREGEFSFELEINCITQNQNNYLKALSDFVIKAINDLKLEFPNEIKLYITE